MDQEKYKRAVEIKDKIYSQLEILLEVDSKNVIGITGTKGKSTTSTFWLLKNTAT